MMELKIKTIETGKIIYTHSCKKWIGKSKERKEIADELINKFVFSDFGIIDEIDQLQNNFILSRNFRSSLDLIGKYPLNDNSGYISIKSKKTYDTYNHQRETQIEFNPYSSIPEPKVIRSGNVLKFDFTKVNN